MEISNNLQALQAYSAKLDENASDLSQASFELADSQKEQTGDIARNLTDNISLQNGFDAQVRSIDTKNEILGTVLDIIS